MGAIYPSTEQNFLIVSKPEKIFAEIRNIVETSEADVSTWQSNQERFNRIRMRIKKEKTFPFKNSSNLRMPTADIAIKKVKSGVMSVLFGQSPIVNATPNPGGHIDVAGKIAKFLDHLICDIIKLKPKAEIAVDQSLEKGFYIAKGYWRLDICEREEIVKVDELAAEELSFILMSDPQQVLPIVIERFDIDVSDNVAEHNIGVILKGIEEIRAGKKEVKLIVKDVTYNFPDVDFISPERVYVPSDSGFDIQKAHNVTVEFFLPLDVIKYNSQYKGWDQKVVKKLSSLRGMDYKTIDVQKDEREGIERLNNPSGLVRVWETYGWFNIDGTGEKKKSVVTSLPDFSAVVRKVKLNNFTNKWPLVKIYYDLTDDRWFAHRGVVEALEDVIKEIDVQHNMKIDHQTLNNAPMIVYRTGMVNPRTARVNPSAGIPVNGMQPLDDTIKAINLHNPNAEYSYEREQMILETKIQEMIGQVDYALQSMINKRQPRTLGEVEMQNASAGQTFALDAGHYIMAFSDLFNLIWELWCEYGPDEYEFNYFGQSNQGESIKLSKEEVQNKYKVSVKGNDITSNPQFRVSQAQQIAMVQTNPLFLQAGVINPMTMASGVKRLYQALNIDSWEELVNMQPQPIQPPPQTAIVPQFDELTHGEKAQVLQTFGVTPDTSERITAKHKDNLMVAADIASKIGGEEAIGGTKPDEK